MGQKRGLIVDPTLFHSGKPKFLVKSKLVISSPAHKTKKEVCIKNAFQWLHQNNSAFRIANLPTGIVDHIIIFVPMTE